MEENYDDKPREIIQLTYDEILDFWNDLYFENSSTELNGDNFKHIEKINTSEYSDGDSFKYIVKRDRDGKYFMFDVWEGGINIGYIFSRGENTLGEVFPKTITKQIYV